MVRKNLFLKNFLHRFTGKITDCGVIAPLRKHLYDPLIELIEKEGIGCKEEVVIE